MAANKRAKQTPDTIQRPVKRSRASDGPRRAGDLWVNVQLFRKLSTRAPQTIVFEYPPHTTDYFLKLAALVLGPTKRHKRDRTADAFRTE